MCFFFRSLKQTSHKSTIRTNTFRLFILLIIVMRRGWFIANGRTNTILKWRTYLRHLIGIKTNVPFWNGSWCVALCCHRFDFYYVFTILRVIHCINVDRNDNSSLTHTPTLEHMKDTVKSNHPDRKDPKCLTIWLWNVFRMTCHTNYVNTMQNISPFLRFHRRRHRRRFGCSFNTLWKH